MKVVVLNAKAYSVVDEKTGQVIEGVSAWYLNTNNKTDEGLMPMKVSISKDSNLGPKVLNNCPGVFDFSFDIMPGKGNKAVMKLVDINFINSVDFNSFVE